MPTEPNPEIWTISAFLSEKECEDLIMFSEMRGFQEATVGLRSGARMLKSIRNNYRLEYDDEALSARLWEKLAPTCPKKIEGLAAIGLNEHFRFYKYEDAQRFKKHRDGRYRRHEMEESRITFMVYLNDDFEGGETSFEHRLVKPEAGMALCFMHELKHEGRPVTSGSKYVLRSDVMYRKTG